MRERNPNKERMKMRAKNISAVYSAWLSGNSARAGNVSTDGQRLWSYNLLIGSSHPTGALVADYTAAGEWHSATTSKHVNAAARAAGVLKLPPGEFRKMIGG